MRRNRGARGAEARRCCSTTTASAASITARAAARNSCAAFQRCSTGSPGAARSVVGANRCATLGRSPRRRESGIGWPAHTNSTSSRSPSKCAPADLASHEAVGQEQRPPVRTDRDEQLLVGAPEPDLVAFGERHVHREHERVADRVDAQRLDVGQAAGDIEVAVEIAGEALEILDADELTFGELGGEDRQRPERVGDRLEVRRPARSSTGRATDGRARSAGCGSRSPRRRGSRTTRGRYTCAALRRRRAARG